MEKIREIFHKIAQFFTSLFEITAYADNQKATNDALERIDANLKALQNGQNIPPAADLGGPHPQPSAGRHDNP